MAATTETTAISNSEDILDVRDIIARYEFLEAGEDIDQDADSEDQQERVLLRSLLDDLKDNGGDEEWKGAWYPLTLIRDSYFTKYAEELAHEIGAINSNNQIGVRSMSWPLQFIDWDAAAEALKMDYFAVDFGGVEYFARA